MPYGYIINNTFRVIWREKKLWLFGIIGLALSSLGTGLYMTTIFNWQSQFMAIFSDPAALEFAQPEDVMNMMLGSMGWLFGGLGILACFSLIGYILNLIMRGATISEAGKALNDESTDFSRGASSGLHHALKVFAIDVLWWLPGLLLGLCGLLGGLAAFGGIVSAAFSAGESSDEAVGAILAMIGSIFAVIGLLACLAFIIAIVTGIFAPLMYQSAVQGRQSLGASIKQGWQLARANLGAMIVFLIIIFGLQLVVGFLVQLASFPLTGVWMTSYFSMLGNMLEGGPPPGPSTLNSFLLLAGGLLLALVTLFAYSFSQTFSLTMYADVYRRLSGQTSTAENEQLALEGA